MNKTVNTLWIVGILGLAIALSSHAEATPMRHTMKNLLMSIPNLNSDQKNRVTHLTNMVRMQTAPLREQLTAIRSNMARLWAGDPVDKQAMSVKHEELLGVVAKMAAVWAAFFAQLHDVLTPAQRNWVAARGPGFYGSDAGYDLGIVPKDCLCGEPQPAQHPGPVQ